MAHPFAGWNVPHQAQTMSIPGPIAKTTTNRATNLHFLLPAAAITIASLVAHTYGIASLPRGFYVDESSIAYNAHLIASTGRDEHGAAWPLYFKAFGEYKNP